MKLNSTQIACLNSAKTGPLFRGRGLFCRPGQAGFTVTTITKLVNDGLLEISKTKFGKPMALITPAGRAAVAPVEPKKRLIEPQYRLSPSRLADRLAP